MRLATQQAARAVASGRLRLGASGRLRLGVSGCLRLGAVLALTSVGLMVGASEAADPAPRPLTPGWFAGRGSAGLAAGTAAAAGPVSAQGASAAVQQSLDNLKAAAAAVSAAQAVQSKARSAAQTTAQALKFGDGLGVGALQPAAVATWQNASAPAQSSAGGRTTVSITQTGAKAVLTWTTFNIGAATDLVFDQSAGGAAATGWVAFNRVSDPAAQPSQILGSIRAPGQVYVLNRNGILFGRGSEVDVNALLATTADFRGGIAGFQANGIYSVAGVNGLLPAFGGSVDTDALAGSTVTVEAGARITTPPPGSVLSRGGYVMLLGAGVRNDGAIDTPQGQTVLAAGRQFIVAQGYSSSGAGDALATTLGSQVAVIDGGSAANGGIITASRGDISLVGRAVAQEGVVLSTTTTSQRGTVHLLTDLADSLGSVTLAPGSLTQILPELDNTDTALNSQRAALITTSAQNNQARLTTAPTLNNSTAVADRLDLSRIEIGTGGTVDFGTGSITMAQAGQIAVAAGAGRIFAAAGAQLDVSGVAGLVRPASDNVITVNIQPTEMRDSPANRDAGKLAGKNVSIDIRNLTLVAASAAYPTDRYYTPGGLLEVSGYLNNIGHTIGEWSTVGGTVTLAASQVVVQRGAGVNLAGGSLAYQAGLVNSSWLTTADGQIYAVAAAPAALVYTGVYTGYAVTDSKWGTSAIYTNALLGTQQVAQQAYAVGKDAGRLVLSTPTAVFEGRINAGVVTGANQTGARPASVSDAFALGQTVAPLGGSLALGQYGPGGLNGLYATDVVLAGCACAVADGLSAGGAVPAGRALTAWIAGGVLNGSGLAGVQVSSAGAVAIAGPLTLAPGGQVTLTAPSVRLAADLVAPGAVISLGNRSDIDGQYLTSGGTAQVSLGAGVRVNAAGMWNNRVLDPTDARGAGFIAGGSVTIDSSQGVSLGAGSVIDVSAGGALAANGSLKGGKGGSIFITGDDPLGGAATAAVVLDGGFSGFGASGGGALSLTAPLISIAGGGVPPGGVAAGTLALAPDLFQRGFSSYVINGMDGLTVAPGTRLAAVAPAYGKSFAASGVPSGSDAAAAYDLALAPLFVADPAKATLSQRGGASLALQSVRNQQGGAVTIGRDAAVEVDPGQSVALRAYGSIVVDGSITAHGGTVSLVNTRYQDGTDDQRLSLYAPGLALWLGASSLIDVSGIARTASDNAGLAFGLVQDGGTISMGGIGGKAGDGALRTTAAQIVIRPGARLEANGARGLIDPAAGREAQLGGGVTRPVLVGGNGGTIALSSYSGIFTDGTMRAAGGSASAAGGTLALTLETPTFSSLLAAPPSSVLVPRVMTISQTGGSLLPADLAEGTATPASAFGRARLSAGEAAAGGFGALALSDRGLFLFDGAVNLRTAQSITFDNGIFADTSLVRAVHIEAPYVRIGGDTTLTVAPNATSGLITQSWLPPTLTGAADLHVTADQIDLVNDIRLGTGARIPVDGDVTHRLSYAGFGTVVLRSTGDMRFLAASGSQSGGTSLVSDGNITLEAAQIYPASGAQATVVAGYRYAATGTTNPFKSGTVLQVRRTTATLPATPMSLGGSITLAAGFVRQAGVVVAPLGSVRLGVSTTATALLGFGKSTAVATRHIWLEPGSVTSVSAEGLTLPYGGTSDGVSYLYAGGTAAGFKPVITLSGRAVTALPGSLIDLHGGGTLTGGGGEVRNTDPTSASALISQGFIAGRGGSTDVLVTPLLRFNGSSTASPTATLASNPVYAIVPGYDAGFAPVTPLDQSSGYYGALPGLGQRISVGAGVPGLAAGTYTLLPSYYALLPGAFRVELAPGHIVPDSPVLSGFGTWQAGVVTSTANTSVRAALAVPAFFTAADVVRKYAQYDEQSYSDFQIAQAATFDRNRPSLPRDAGTLTLAFPSSVLRGGAFDFAGRADFTPGTDGYGGTVDVTAGLSSTIEVIGSKGALSSKTIAISAAALDALGAPRLVIGGTLAYSPGSANSTSTPAVVLSAQAGGVQVDAGAVLSAADVFLVAASNVKSGAITLADGAVIDTIGAGAPAYDSATTGLAYDVQRATGLLVSNGRIVLAPVNLSAAAASGPLSIANGARILAAGSIVSSTEKSVVIGAGATFGAASITLSVPVVNFGAPAAPVAGAAATPVPSGLQLDQSVLARLLAGDPAHGVPALSALNITASGAVNFYGSVDFSASGAGLQELRLNTPAIYGQGAAGDVARLSVATLVWNGVAASGTVASSLLPQGVVANGAGSGHGALDIETTRLVLGYATDVTPSLSVSLDRLIVGFSQVTLGASQSITFNNAGSLSVFARQAGAGFGGVGGVLTLATPLLTGASGGKLAITAGDSVLFATPAGSAAVGVAQPGQGGSLTVNAGTIEVASTIAVNAGAIALTATAGNVQIDSTGRLDASGPTVVLFDQTRGSPGGTISLESRTGDVIARAGSVIDVSAVAANAGSLAATAPGGQPQLDGILRGGAPDGAQGGSFTLKTAVLGDFAALDARLDTGGFTFARRFDIATGDLVIAGTVQAHQVAITASGGSLEISGTVDASGSTPGSIALAARDGLRLDAGAALDAHASVAQVDSAGVPIAAANRADVSLSAGGGMLIIAAGATIDVRNASGTDRGTIELYAPRRAGAGGTMNDVAVDLSAAPTLLGASSIALYGMATYTPAGGMVDQALLAAADKDSAAFIDAAAANAGLRGRLAGVSALAGFHLRPGVAIVAAGDLTVAGDLNLEAMRYTSLAGTANAEPGMLVLRASGQLNVFGSITDGFGTPVDTARKVNPDDNGWLVLKGIEPLSQTIVVPTEVALAAGTSFDPTSRATLSYPITIASGAVTAHTLIPADVAIAGAHRIGVGGWVTTSAIRDAKGTLLYPAGTLLPEGTKLSHIQVDAGAVLPFDVGLAANTVWPAGASLAAFKNARIVLSAAAVVPAGGAIPAGTKVVLPGNAASVALRPSNGGVQGSVLATAPLDTSGQSWSIRLVGGADLASANSAAVTPASVLAAAGGGGGVLLSDPHYVNPLTPSAVQPGISVIRTGTGDLSMFAGGDITTASLFGIYTAGVQSPDVAAGYQLPQGTGFGTGGKVLSTTVTGGYNYNNLLGAYQAWYPTGGGDVQIAAQGAVTGKVISIRSNGTATYQSDAVGNWLWRQGGSSGQATAWWINFGAYVDSSTGSNTLQLAGFTGIGALGGGNVRVSAGTDAGNIAVSGTSVTGSTALDVVVASTGRVAGDGVTLTGGGTVAVNVGGTLNGANTSFGSNGLANALFGVIGSMRGTVTVNAGAIGKVVPSGGLLSVGPLVQSLVDAYGGPLLLIGDATAGLSTRGDLVLGGVIDPTRVTSVGTTPWVASIDGVATKESGGGRVAFSLWSAGSGITLFAAGGTLVPTLDITGGAVGADMNITYPPSLRAVAATGSIVYASIQGTSKLIGPALELAPSASGQLELLAGGGINAAGLSSRIALGIDISGAAPDTLTSPLRPAFQGTYEPAPGSQFTQSNITNALDFAGATSLFAFAPDTPSGVLHGGDAAPARIYAAGGDIVDLNFGETWRFFSGSATLATWYLAAKPALIQASRDIINSGIANLLPTLSFGDQTGLKVSRNLILNTSADNASVVSAGRDIFYANFAIAGPGTLEVGAGRNLFQADQGSLYSLGQIVGTTGTSGGAGILLMAGLAQNAPDWAGFQSLYLGSTTATGDLLTYVAPSVAAGSRITLSYRESGGTVSDPGLSSAAAPAGLSATIKRNPPPSGAAAACVSGLLVCDNHSIPAAPLATVARSYEDDLVAWLQANAGFTAPARPVGLSDAAWAGLAAPLTHAAALSRFAAMPLYQRIPFLMQVYNNELAASGLEQTGALTAADARYSGTSVARLGSLARGKEANAALVPDPLVASPAASANSITLYGGSGVSTAFGGAISAFAPGGRLVLGLSSQAPPTPASGQPAAGLITFGSGDVDVSTYGSVLLGQSRIFTTFGGAINIWSEGGDINAGTGSKTTSVYQPPRIDYGSYGTIALSPSAPTSGAGIATLAPVAGVPAGDVILVVELGVIDTGEAGIRSSGRTSFTGAVVGSGGVAAAGGSFGLPSIAVPSVGALAAASGTTAAASASAGGADPNRRAVAQAMPSIITVEVISFGGDSFQ